MNKKHLILGEEFELKFINFYDELSAIDFTQNIELQIMFLDEDLLQLSFESGIVIDIGWYPAFDTKGEFIVCKVVNGCWDKPEYKCNVGWDKSGLISKLREAIGEARIE